METNKVEEISRLIAYAKELNIDLNIKGNFNTRFNLQKLAFLLRVLNNEDISDFGLYKHGPYSRDETTLYYGYDNGEITPQKYNLKENYLEKLKAIFPEKGEKVIEGIATVLYLIKTGLASWKDIYLRLKEAKPNLSLEESVNAVNSAKELVLTEKDYEQIRERIKEEFEDLENAHSEDTFDTL